MQRFPLCSGPIVSCLTNLTPMLCTRTRRFEILRHVPPARREPGDISLLQIVLWPPSSGTPYATRCTLKCHCTNYPVFRFSELVIGSMFIYYTRSFVDILILISFTWFRMSVSASWNSIFYKSHKDFVRTN